jgi:hypothetical protein
VVVTFVHSYDLGCQRMYYIPMELNIWLLQMFQVLDFFGLLCNNSRKFSDGLPIRGFEKIICEKRYTHFNDENVSHFAPH